MMKSFALAAALAAGMIAAPASAAVFTFNFTNTGPYATQAGPLTRNGINYGNAFLFTATADDGSTLRVRVSAFSRDGDVLGLARLARWSGNGLGALNQAEGTGGGNGHTVDDLNGDDFLVFQFESDVRAESASAGAFRQWDAAQGRWETDNDFTARAGKSTVNWWTAPSSLNGLTMFGEHQVNNDGTTTVRGINPDGNIGNLLIIRAGGTDDRIDSMKLRTLTVSTVAVPEPATWAMMIAGFGLVGAGLRRRRSAPASVIA